MEKTITRKEEDFLRLLASGVTPQYRKSPKLNFIS